MTCLVSAFVVAIVTSLVVDGALGFPDEVSGTLTPLAAGVESKSAAEQGPLRVFHGMMTSALVKSRQFRP